MLDPTRAPHLTLAGVLVAYQTDMEEDIDYEQPFVLVVMDYVVMVLFCFECLVLISAEGEHDRAECVCLPRSSSEPSYFWYR